MDSQTPVQSLAFRITGAIKQSVNVAHTITIEAGICGKLFVHFAFVHGFLRQRERTNMPVIFFGECSTR